MNQFQKTRSTQQLGSHATAAMAACRTITGGLGRSICLCAVCSLGELNFKRKGRNGLKTISLFVAFWPALSQTKVKMHVDPKHTITCNILQHRATSCNTAGAVSSTFRSCRCAAAIFFLFRLQGMLWLDQGIFPSLQASSVTLATCAYLLSMCTRIYSAW